MTAMRHREPRLTVRALRPLISGLSTLGYDPAPFLQAQGIADAMLLDPDATVPMSACVGLLADGVRATGDDNLGLHVAEHAELGSFDVHFYAMVSSPTLGAAFERVCRYQRLIHETSEVRLETSGDRAVLSHRLSGGMPAPRQTAELLLGSWVRAGRVATRTRWSPAEVRFAHPEPRDLRQHERFFDAPLRFATGENALVLPAALLDLPCRRTDLSLLSLLDGYAADRLGKPRAATFANRARAALTEELQAETRHRSPSGCAPRRQPSNAPPQPGRRGNVIPAAPRSAASRHRRTPSHGRSRLRDGSRVPGRILGAERLLPCVQAVDGVHAGGLPRQGAHTSAQPFSHIEPSRPPARSGRPCWHSGSMVLAVRVNA